MPKMNITGSIDYLHNKGAQLVLTSANAGSVYNKRSLLCYAPELPTAIAFLRRCMYERALAGDTKQYIVCATVKWRDTYRIFPSAVSITGTRRLGELFRAVGALVAANDCPELYIPMLNGNREEDVISEAYVLNEALPDSQVTLIYKHASKFEKCTEYLNYKVGHKVTPISQSDYTIVGSIYSYDNDKLVREDFSDGEIGNCLKKYQQDSVKGLNKEELSALFDCFTFTQNRELIYNIGTILLKGRHWDEDKVLEVSRYIANMTTAKSTDKDVPEAAEREEAKESLPVAPEKRESSEVSTVAEPGEEGKTRILATKDEPYPISGSVSDDVEKSDTLVQAEESGKPMDLQSALLIANKLQSGVISLSVPTVDLLKSATVGELTALFSNTDKLVEFLLSQIEGVVRQEIEKVLEG